ncbi:MAG: NAD(+) synthase [Bradyrhizobium sp.]
MTADAFRITLAQLNPTAGDIAANAAKARAARAKAATDGADLVVLPELFITGHLPQTLVLNPEFQAACRAAVESLARLTADGGPAVLIGTPWVDDGRLYNACVLLDAGRIAALRFKTNLPDHAAFDQTRLFARGPAAGPVSVRGVRIGVAIGEDIWVEESEGYENVVETLAETGAELIVVPAAEPTMRDAGDRRLSAAVARVTESDLPLLWLNQVGGQDDGVFDGASFVLNADLSVAAQLPGFVEDITTLTLSKGDDGWQCRGPVAALIEGDEADYAACVLGLRDRVAKGGFTGAVLGLTGDVDSALSAAMAVDAVGPGKVRGVLLPGPDTSQVAQDAATAFAARLGVACEVLPIAAAVDAFEKILPGPLASGAHHDLLARVRITLLMALASTSGALAVATRNTSDLPVGRVREMGDVTGGFTLLRDITAAQVIRLATLRGRWKPADALGPSGEVISPDLIASPPGAELHDDQMLVEERRRRASSDAVEGRGR